MKRCMGCMSEYGDALSVCPVCGFSPRVMAEERKKFPEAIGSGAMLSKRYRLGRVLSYTDFSIIYNAWDSLLMMHTAVREFYPLHLCMRTKGSGKVKALTGSEHLYREVREAFEMEALTLSRNQDKPFIVNNFRVLRENGTSYVCMEYLTGETLGDFISGGGLSDLPEAEFFFLLKRLRESIREVHRCGILHLNLSPEAVYLCADGALKLIDFGLAKAVFYRSLTGEAEVYEEAYAAPEVLEEGAGLRESDLYSLGQILTSLLEEQALGEEDRRDALLSIAASLTSPDFSERRDGAERLDTWIEEYRG